MKSRLLIIILSLTFFNALNAQTTFTGRKLPAPIINKIIDSLKNTLRNDLVKSSLFFIEADRYERNAYGCIILYENDSVYGYRFEFENNTFKKAPLNSNALIKDDSLLKQVFNDPYEFLLNFPEKRTPNTTSHDNKCFFFFEDNNKAILNKEFFHSLFLIIKSEKTKVLLSELQLLTSE